MPLCSLNFLLISTIICWFGLSLSSAKFAHVVAGLCLCIYTGHSYWSFCCWVHRFVLCWVLIEKSPWDPCEYGHGLFMDFSVTSPNSTRVLLRGSHLPSSIYIPTWINWSISLAQEPQDSLLFYWADGSHSPVPSFPYVRCWFILCFNTFP